MADTIEKIYCDRDNSNDALYALLSQKNQTDPMAMAAALNGGAMMLVLSSHNRDRMPLS